MTSLLSNAGNSLSDGAASLGKGVKDTGSTVGQGVTDAGSAVGKGASNVGQGVGISDGGSVAFKGLNDAGQTVGKGVGDAGQTIGKGIGDAGQAGWQAGSSAIGKGFSSGFEIAASLSKETLDLQRNVAGGVSSLGGTAIDGVITAVTTTTGVVFDPVANSLKSIEGLEGLGEGIDSINGLSTTALQSVGETTKKAIKLAGRVSLFPEFTMFRPVDPRNPSGQAPTFFDPDADGIVNFADTQRGFALLGLKENHAKIAAYALHSTFTYSTADAWLTIPNTSTLPVKIDNISNTRWGRNWGNYQRVDWVSDADVETFFGIRERQSWTEYWTDIKSYFGTALLIFEWGTTWPFAVPQLAELEPASPIVSQLGLIMRTVILPTIVKGREHARKLSAGEEEKDEAPEPPTGKPSEQ
ncbi:Caleosin domain-containing protein [Mycena sanguinolenta]|uniref:Caleosin domain-containing protein n=1 Tax=Mycena sanguinolenta TaxID=230812 RepID=A0A8H6XHU8_9AGAR|nr:Caleosin domain-containing protein [Mycena sanguinolenta]